MENKAVDIQYPGLAGVNSKTSVSDLVREYVGRQRSLKRSLAQGYIHYTDLGRRIASHYQIDQIDACKIASRRLALELMREEASPSFGSGQALLQDVAVQDGVQVLVVKGVRFEELSHRELADLLRRGDCLLAAGAAGKSFLVTKDESAEEMRGRLKSRLCSVHRNMVSLKVKTGSQVAGGKWVGERLLSTLSELGVAVNCCSTTAGGIVAICPEAELASALALPPQRTDESVSAFVHSFLQTHRSVRNALSLGLANYAVLARQISEAYHIEARGALASGLRRFAQNRSRAIGVDEENLLFLRNSVVTAQADVVASYFRPDEFEDGFAYLEQAAGLGVLVRYMGTPEGLTVYAHSANLGRPEISLSKRFANAARVGCLEITASELTSGRAGALDHLLALLYEEGIEPLEYSVAGAGAVLCVRGDQIGLAVHGLLVESRR